MMWRSFLATSGWNSLIFYLSTVFVVAGAPSTSESPNILWIVTDDQRPDSLACFNLATTGQPSSPLGPVRSPGIDRLAKRGTLFTRAYCNAPSCAPSRAVMMTGRYPHHSGIYGFELGHEKTENFRRLVPEVLKEAGYQTANFGKPGYYIFRRDKPWNFRGEFDTSVLPYYLERQGLTDIKHDIVQNKGISTREEIFYVEDVPGQIQEVPRRIEDIAKSFCLTPLEKTLGIIRSQTFEENKGEILSGRCPRFKTRDDFIYEAFTEFLSHPNQDYTAITGLPAHGIRTDKPVFIHVGFHFPHTPVIPPKNYRDQSSISDYRIPEFSREEMDALPSQLTEYQNRWDCSHMNRDEKLRAIRDYFAFCAFGDDLVAKTVEEFQKCSEKAGRSWVLIYVCGDNGWHLGENGVMAKFGPYEKSTRQAILGVSSNPSIFPPGKIVDRFVEFVDLAPTFYRLSGLSTNGEQWGYLDGRDLVEEAAGLQPEREYVITEMDPGMGPRAVIRTKEFAFSMRTRPKKNMNDSHFRWAVDAEASDLDLALFDLRKDPLERQNLASSPRYLQVVENFREKLQKIVLGDRTEVDWSKEGRNFFRSTWGIGADDKKSPMPLASIPAL